MDRHLIEFIAAGAFVGLICSFTSAGIFYFFMRKTFHSDFNSLGRDIITSMFSDQKNSTGSNEVQLLKDAILHHFDIFMQTKLLTEMPVLKMFVDDELLKELKQVFKKELDEELPILLSTTITKSIDTGTQTSPLFKKTNHFISTGVVQIIKTKIKSKLAFTACLSAVVGAIMAYIVYLIY